ncbi:ArsR/SmtB family transcription factor [Halocatena marina]|uniref:ArsR/SmtB family transcription factor n=1 Tax=Halocatena marina TaxID=2934937 RepID=A0ABD5YLA4_9EURY|nr:helix-turn-helix domain-containing protein [Halocatena marina]
MSLLPLRGESQSTPNEPRVLGLDNDAADEAFETLTASTTRTVLSIIYDRPSTPTEIRDEIDTSLQNVHYHLGKLEDAGLIEPSGVGYSEKGTEMTVYAPANEAVVLFAGRESDHLRLRDFLRRALGAATVLAGASAILALSFGRFGIFDVKQTGGGPTALEAPTAPAVDPVLMFLLGGVFSLAVIGLFWYFDR